MWSIKSGPEQTPPSARPSRDGRVRSTGRYTAFPPHDHYDSVVEMRYIYKTSSPFFPGFFYQLSFFCPNFLLSWANGSVGKKRGRHNNARTEIETAGSGKDLDFWLWPSEPAAASCSTLR